MGDSNHVLLLQGPNGTFFSRFAAYLTQRGRMVWKINFNGGDLLFSGNAQVVNYRGTACDWPDYLAAFLSTHAIGCIYLFGDCRFYHQLAIRVADNAGVQVFVFEEGYIRPDYITLEKGGVNAYSSLPSDPYFYLNLPAQPKPARIAPAGASFTRMACASSAYYLATLLLRRMFPSYRHHRSESIVGYALTWIRSATRRISAMRRDAALTRDLSTVWSKRYFLVPLQVFNDAQVTRHSSYRNIEAFIAEVLHSFACNAPKNTQLVFKHHPMDRGDRHYARLINGLAAKFGIAERVRYAHQVHLPSALDHARGVVVINSTVGLSALLHRAPVKTMGRAIYDMEGLTCQRSLDRFWRKPGQINQRLHQSFRRYVIARTQLNGSFYGRNPFALAETAHRHSVQYNSVAVDQQA